MTKNILILILLVALGGLGWVVLNQPDDRTAGERIGEAIDALPEGVDKAAEKLEDQTPQNKIGNAIQDFGKAIKETGKE